MSEDILKNHEWKEVLWKPLAQEKASLLGTEQKVIRVAAYARTSKKISVQLQSLEIQIDYFTRFVQKKPHFKLVSIYYDEGVSGTKMDNRLGMTRLLRHCREGKIDYIVTKSISRFSRNVKELMEVVKELQKLNVGLYFQKENLDTSKEYNEFLLATYAALAQNEVETLGKNVSWGYEQRTLRGVPKFERILGYHVHHYQKKPHITVDEEEAMYVKKVYQLYLEGKNYNEIAQYLMLQKVISSRGSAVWDGTTVKKILTNVTYTGNRLATFKSNDLLNKGKATERQSYYIENNHQAIIDLATFEEVQKRIQATEYKKNMKKAEFRSLSSRILCGLCGCNYQFLTDYATPCWRCRKSKLGMEICSLLTGSMNQNLKKPLRSDLIIRHKAKTEQSLIGSCKSAKKEK
ncbi:recombinase family protein [Heliorestis acidaminivorans]|uniref:Recombinase family protein n=1 Tax=Heliorestis acidaminivorans TaxID=553427 RepID=A0A6I0F867_9FIRM|nr:recombinase family protein [Heliorestis acidaminivorans]KAB2953688.1 recombinase family protein [Heliorestis acidaminivorans]